MRKLLVVWKQPQTRRRYVIATLTNDNSVFKFEYVNPELQEASKVGFDYYPGFQDINRNYENNEFFTNIASRLPNPRREDYLDLLNAFGLESDVSQWDILVATKGRLLTDTFEFIQEFTKDKIEFDVAGTRYSEDCKICRNKIKVNSNIKLELDENNEKDENAVKVVFNLDRKYELGYIPRYYSKCIAPLLKQGIKYSAKVKETNFNSPLYDENITVTIKLIFQI